VRDDNHRVAAAEPLELRNEQVAGLVKVDAGQRRYLGGQQVRLERAARGGRRAAGIAAEPLSSRVAVVPKTLNVSLARAGGAAAALMTPPR